jgi:hypothetical protein
MARGKLILICQSGGEFVTNEDGSMSYTGGEAHAVDINRETLFNDLKLKLAEMWNLEYNSLSMKYFLPGNRRTLINLSNDKNLKRMYDFHASSVTADVFVTGRAGFDFEALNIRSRYFFLPFFSLPCCLVTSFLTEQCCSSFFIFSCYYEQSIIATFLKITAQPVMAKKFHVVIASKNRMG